MGNQLTKINKFELMNHFLALCVLTLVVSFFIAGCGQPGTVTGEPRSSQYQTATVPEIVPAEYEPEPSKPVKEYSKTVTVTETNVSDVIIVIDNSASMRFEQANMAERFSSLLDEMKSLKWRLGIVTTDVSKDQPKKYGRFLEFIGLPGVDQLTSDMDPEVVKAAFAATIQRPSREGHANEQGIKATYMALERRPEWLKSLAALNVVVVTDADETPYKGKAEKRNNPSDLLKFVKSENPEKSFFFHSIIVKEGDEACLKKDDNEGYGRSYAWLSQSTGGIIGDVCQKDYSNQLKMIGEKDSQKVKTVILDCAPIQGSVVVKFGSEAETITDFVVQESKVIFAQALPVGTTQIQYNCESSL